MHVFPGTMTDVIAAGDTTRTAVVAVWLDVSSNVGENFINAGMFLFLFRNEVCGFEGIVGGGGYDSGGLA